MKKTFLLLPAFLLISLLAVSQNKVNLIIFSEDSDPFFVFINGVKQNTSPETNVKFTELSPNVSLRIEFTDIALPQIKQSMALEPNIEHTFRIKKDVKKQVKLRYFGGVPLTESASGITTVAYHTADDATTSNSSNVNNAGTNSYGNTTTINSTTVNIANTQATPNSNSDNVSVNIGIAGVGMNVNVNGMDQSNQMNMSSQSSSTVTHQSSSSYSNTDKGDQTQSTAVKTQAKGCQVAMSQANFNKMKESIESKPFSETKMSTAKVATKNACLSVNQVKEITKLFNMDDDKLEYAKYAYTYCIDKANYYQVGDVFSFSTSTEALNNFLSEN